MIQSPLATDTPKNAIQSVCVALVGNPNTGKTTLFNALTGLNQKVGNYSGVTVERKCGSFSVDGVAVDLIDLPGSYSLAARSPDEMIVADVLLGQQSGEKPIDAVLAIVDASNIQRNFYLLSQVLELGRPVVIALNMIDIAQTKGIEIDAEGLSHRLGVPVIPICARRKSGIDKLLQTLAGSIAQKDVVSSNKPVFPDSLLLAMSNLQTWVKKLAPTDVREIPEAELFRALIDRGGYAEQRLGQLLGSDFLDVLNRERQISAERLPLTSLEVKYRYEWIHAVLEPFVKKPQQPIRSYSDRIDRILTHRIYGSAVFFCVMALVFQSIYTWAAPVMDLIDAGFHSVGNIAAQWIPEGALQSLVVDGVIAGVGGVLIFLPQIAILFFFIAILEDCGYLPRAAFLMDRLLSFCGLSGKSFIPMLSSFACAVPGVMATRTIEDRNDRLTTILVAPLMSCSARLPVYLIFIAAFIPERSLWGTWISLQGLTLFALYVLGVLIAIPVAWLVKRRLSKGRESVFLLELPSYKWPTYSNVVLYVYDRSKSFVVRAGTLIFCITVLVWALAYFPRPASIHERYDALRSAASADQIEDLNNQENGEYIRQSFLGRMGRALEPVVKPLGWDWRIGMATLAAFPAREIVVAVLGTIFNLGSSSDGDSQVLRTALRAATWDDGTPLFTTAAVLSILVFFALCCQCGATLATIKRETNSYGWAFFTFGYMTVLAYGGAFCAYQFGCILGLG